MQNLEKNKRKLIKFNIKEFYPSITKKLLNKALEFGNNYKTITEQDKSIIHNAAKSILVNKEEMWTKQSTSEKDYELFDITKDGEQTWSCNKQISWTLYTSRTKTNTT